MSIDPRVRFHLAAANIRKTNSHHFSFRLVKILFKQFSLCQCDFGSKTFTDIFWQKKTKAIKVEETHDSVVLFDFVVPEREPHVHAFKVGLHNSLQSVWPVLAMAGKTRCNFCLQLYVKDSKLTKVLPSPFSRSLIRLGDCRPSHKDKVGQTYSTSTQLCALDEISMKHVLLKTICCEGIKFGVDLQVQRLLSCLLTIHRCQKFLLSAENMVG